MGDLDIKIQALRAEFRSAMGDRGKLSKLHAKLVENVNNSYGEERMMLNKLKREVKDALTSRVLDNW